MPRNLAPQSRREEKPIFGHRLIVGVAVDSINNYGRQILHGIHLYANVRREWLFYEELRPALIDAKRWPQCDGIIFAAIPPHLARKVARKAKYSVSCSSTTDPAVMPVVSGDNVAIGRVAAEHLLDRRLQNFAYFGMGDKTGLQRLEGFRTAVQSRGFDCLTWRGDAASPEMGDHRHWPELLAWIHTLPKPVGILARDDLQGSHLSAACLNGGVIVPDQVAIISVNNDEVFCEASWPPLSSVEVDFARIGYLAARQLDTLLHGDEIPAAERHLLVGPTSVVARLSTDIQLVDDATVATAVAYIREHGRTGCSVSDVLRVVPVSRSWLERQFKEKLGRTPHDEIVRVRMEHARRLLVDSAEPVSRISDRCGFHAVQNFNRAFTQYEGISPAAFRRSHRTQ